MASSSLNQKSNFHARSNSLPSRPHPVVPQIDEHLCRLKSNEAASTSSSSIGQKLSGLRDLYELVDSLLQLPLTQNSLAQQCNDKHVDELLNGSLRLLDMCGFTNEAKEYLASRKKAKKLINKSLRDLKSKCNVDNDVEATFSKLREVEGVTLTVFESLLAYISGTNMQAKSTKWSLVSKLVHSKRVTCEGEATEDNEFERVDAVLNTLIGQKTRKCSNLSSEDAQIELQKLESSIQDLEDGVECILRLLIKTRVSVLNILSH
ncbi:hypothetical protein PTKIN_Ptkin10aG0170800 [Pterospermum kingtungense]